MHVLVKDHRPPDQHWQQCQVSHAYLQGRSPLGLHLAPHLLRSWHCMDLLDAVTAQMQVRYSQFPSDNQMIFFHL